MFNLFLSKWDRTRIVCYRYEATTPPTKTCVYSITEIISRGSAHKLLPPPPFSHKHLIGTAHKQFSPAREGRWRRSENKWFVEFCFYLPWATEQSPLLSLTTDSHFVCFPTLCCIMTNHLVTLLFTNSVLCQWADRVNRRKHPQTLSNNIARLSDFYDLALTSART